ncbi:hypothetical protein IQ07DRAFT_616803 [Pyrenochaeta sp. DS3sAY3a]|nr:hypothetical protein IQ07DRAFT_616803 [Pyrenochaeta sp. DS3sAY3a]
MALMDLAWQSALLELATEVQQLTTQIVKDLAAKNLRETTSETDSETVLETPAQISLHVLRNDAARDLLRPVNGPRNDARNFRILLVRSGSLPPKTRDSKASWMDEDRVGYFLRILAMDGGYEEVEKDVFKNMSRSVLYLRGKLDEFFRAASGTFANIQEPPLVSNGQNNAYATGYGTDFDQISRGKVIDVGGDSGYRSVSLARVSLKQIHALQQAHILSSAIHNGFSDLIDRVTLIPHNTFTPQPVLGAPHIGARSCLGESPPEAPLLINDGALPALGEASRFHDIHMRQVDIIMMQVALGAEQRTEEQFRRLLSDVDSRFKGNVGLIEAHLHIDTARHTEGLAVAEASKDASADDQEQDASAVAHQQKRTETCL